MATAIEDLLYRQPRRQGLGPHPRQDSYRGFRGPHLTIEKLLTKNKRVLVVYGSNHLVTLSEVLKRRLGTPEIKSYQ